MRQSTLIIADSLAKEKLHFVDVNGVRTRYYEDGTGAPLVLLSGGQFGSLYSLDSWSLNLPGLAQHFHVYALDKLGQGYTDNPTADAEYTWEALFRHTGDFLQTAGVTQGHMVGHSRGAFLALCLALERPELVKSLVMVDSSTAAPEDPQYPSNTFYDELERRTPVGPPTPETVRMEPDAQAYRREQVTDDFIQRMYEIALLPKSQEAQQKMQGLRFSTWLPSLNRKREEILRVIDKGGLSVPTLMIWGFNDRSAPLLLGLKLFERICAKTPQADLHIINGAGHYSFRDQPQAFNRTVQAFCG